MDEYIGKGALYDALWDAKEEKKVKSLKDVFDFIDKFSIADVVEVVRCKNCKYLVDLRCEHPDNIHNRIHLNYFCGHGERKEGADNDRA